MKDLASNIEIFELHKKEAIKLFKTICKQKIIFLFKNRKLKLIKSIALIYFLIFLFRLELTQKAIAEFIPAKEKLNTIFKVIYKEEKTHTDFINDLATFESSGRYDVVKKAGDYWGRYQLGPIARKELGINKITQPEFLSNHILQDGLVTALLIRNKNYLTDYIGKYEGKKINDIYITQSGLLAGAHLCGHLSVIKFLESNGKNDAKDGNGIPVSKYIHYFCNYNLNL